MRQPSALDRALQNAGVSLDRTRTALGGKRTGKQKLPNPRGYYVYVLVGHDDEIVYVGQSRNLYARLGAHMQDEQKLAAIASIEFIDCGTQQTMCDVERELIGFLAPSWNKVHNPLYRAA